MRRQKSLFKNFLSGARYTFVPLYRLLSGNLPATTILSAVAEITSPAVRTGHRFDREIIDKMLDYRICTRHQTKRPQTEWDQLFTRRDGLVSCDF